MGIITGGDKGNETLADEKRGGEVGEGDVRRHTYCVKRKSGPEKRARAAMPYLYFNEGVAIRLTQEGKTILESSPVKRGETPPTLQRRERTTRREMA